MHDDNCLYQIYKFYQFINRHSLIEIRLVHLEERQYCNLSAYVYSPDYLFCFYLCQNTSLLLKEYK